MQSSSQVESGAVVGRRLPSEEGAEWKRRVTRAGKISLPQEEIARATAPLFTPALFCQLPSAFEERRRPSGDMFNSRKVQYSPETHRLLKLLMDEVKLTTAQRQQMNESLKKGEPLPVVRRRRFRPSFVDENLFDLKKNYYFQRRSQDQIMHSGAYERERYRFLEQTVDLEREKEKLRNIMEYGKAHPKKKAGSKDDRKMTQQISSEERLEELVSEIEDRLEFLNEMKALGLAKSYEPTIKQEIAAKLREMKKIDKDAAAKYSGAFQGPKPTPTAAGDAIFG